MQIPAKLSCPRLFNMFPRPMLFDLIENKLQHPVVWVQGSPGSGKTTIVGSYINETHKDSLWYQVDSRDEDPATFFNYLRQSSKQLTTRINELPAFTAEYRSNLDAFTRYFFEDFFNILGDKGILILDNIQEVDENSAFYSVINTAIETLGINNNLLCISHKSPPSVLGRHQLNQNIAVINNEDLKLDSTETSQLAHHYGITDQDNIKSCYELTQGWIGGAVQILKQGEICKGSPNLQDTASCLNNYFRHYVFERIPETDRTILLFSSLLDLVSTADIAYIFAISESQSPLASLHENNQFTDLSNAENKQYQYHPLFHKFLNQEVKKLLNTSQYAELLPRIIETMQKQENIEGIADLYCATQNWEKLSQHIIHNAQNLLSLGQDRLLLRWISALPTTRLEQHAWIHFWYSSVIATTDLVTGKHLFDKTYQMFAKTRDMAGMLLSWSYGVDCILWQFRSWGKMKDEYEKIKHFANIDTFDQLPEEILSSFLAGLVICNYIGFTGLAKSKEFSDYGLKFLSSSTLGKENLKLATNIFQSNLWLGNHRTAKMAYITICDINKKYSLNQSEKMACIDNQIAYTWSMDSERKAVEIAKEHINCVNKIFPIWYRYVIFSHSAYAAFSANKMKDGKRLFEIAESSFQEIGMPDGSYVHAINAFLEQKENNYEAAIFHIEKTIESAQRLDSIIHLIVTETCQIKIHITFKNYSMATTLLDTLVIKEKQHSCLLTKVALGFAKTRLALSTKNRKLGLSLLEQTLSNAKEGNIINYWGSVFDELEALCVIALEESIEATFVKQIIKKREIAPKKPPIHLQNWPWKIKIQVFGDFQISIDNKPLVFKRKPQKQVLALLKFIILQGRKPVPEYLIVDALWEQSEGDTAHQNFKTTLFRLRKLLGNKEAILLKNGKVSLNLHYFFIDLWHMGDLQEKLSTAKLPDEQTCIQYDDYQTLLQRDGFLHGDDDYWIKPVREQLEISMFMTCRDLELASKEN